MASAGMASAVLGGETKERKSMEAWAARVFSGADAKQEHRVNPADTPGCGLAESVPFSFQFGGKSSAELLQTWKRSEKKESAPDGRILRVITYSDPASGMELRIEVTLFKDFPAVDWVMRFTNNGKEDSALLEKVLPLDLGVGAPADGKVVLHRAFGSRAEAIDFLPVDGPIDKNGVLDLTPDGGRSSGGVLPYFNMEWPGGGLAWAIGWSGQWAQHIQRTADQIRIQAGQQTFEARLHPGESIRTPRILLVSWEGNDRMRGHHLLRQVQLAHYVPRQNGEIVLPPVSQNSWFIFGEGNGTTEENQIAIARAMPALGVETEWLDAGWFEGGWPCGVGSWVPKSDHFPNGLAPLSAESHRLGLKFLLWFEPERVNVNSRIAKEHPEFILGWGKTWFGNDGLFNLGNPEARQWMTDLVSKCIDEWGIDIYRTDFNMDPLPFWQKADVQDRKGIVENHYIEGLYTMWDELLKRHPKLVFDNCASGGRRIDLEMTSRGLPLSRSDSVTIKAGNPAWDQTQTMGLSLYVPLHSTLATCGIEACSSQKFGLYELRSTMTAGLGICQDTRAKGFPTDVLKKVIREVKMLRPFYTGDFYPLTKIRTDEDAWAAWQLDRPDLGKGFAVFFRRPKSPHPVFEVGLQGLDPQATYEVRNEDTGKSDRLTGAQLASWTVTLEHAPDSVLMTYSKK